MRFFSSLQQGPFAGSRRGGMSTSSLRANDGVKYNTTIVYRAPPDKDIRMTGSFLLWKDSLPMHFSPGADGGNYNVTIPLVIGIHHFKFIVDNQWVVSEEYSTTVDYEGNTNNCISVRPPEQPS